MPVLEALFKKALQHYQKRAPTQLISCEVCKIFKDISFYRTPPVAASGDNKVIWVTTRAGPKCQNGEFQICQFINFRALKKSFFQILAY